MQQRRTDVRGCVQGPEKAGERNALFYLDRDFLPMVSSAAGLSPLVYGLVILPEMAQ